MNSFCIVFDLDKILTLTNVNKFPFASLNRIFAVTLYPEFRIYILREAAQMSSINFLFAKDTTL